MVVGATAATVATVAAAAATVAAAGASTGMALAGGGGGAGTPQVTNIPLPKYQRGLQHYTARLLAENATQAPPSFGEFVSSGGQATFPMINRGMTPREAAQLGIVSPRGGAVPFTSFGGQTTTEPVQLTPQQQLYLGYQRNRSGGEAGGPLAKAYRLERRLENLYAKPTTPQRTQRIERIERRQEQLLDPNRGLRPGR